MLSLGESDTSSLVLFAHARRYLMRVSPNRRDGVPDS